MLLPSRQGYTALLIACQCGTLDLAVLLIANGANLSAVTNRRMSALHLAAEGGDVDLVRMLLMAGAPLETRSSTGDTPLTLATYFGHVEAVEKLLAMGANPNAIDDDGHVAGRWYDEAVAEAVKKQISKTLRAARKQRQGSSVAVGEELEMPDVEPDSSTGLLA
ncbi:similar to ankyrin 2,3/unc44 [Ectocarpus siliculosus]|uniref:Similar to ankyrin 2,3/unc44 n=1 Tax=Ectocarpus siliculosus TaxID=2880 RepID=D8LJW4_ECTSI|nr:similar to ankyrin 2,3/unc44 [Ectocarpus siliculosus]|eukprot:CBN76015.1 similar to ankyrin 2,3/unc44 [Ectocarpus siliculosus]